MTSLRGLFASILNPPASTKMTMRTDNHGEKVSLLGYGCMRLPTNKDGTINQEELNRHVDRLIEGGVNLFDTSPAYCRGQSETVMGKALSRYPRESYHLSTKLSNFAQSQYSLAASKALFENSLKRLQTDYVDYYLLHSVGNNGMATFRKRFVDNNIIPWLFEQKAKGRIRNLGWSYHGDPATVEWLLKKHDTGEFPWDIVLIQMNYVDWRHGHQLNPANQNGEYLYHELERRGIPAFIMEPLMGGRLAQHYEKVDAELVPLDPEATPAKWAFRFAGHFPKVLSVLSGMSKLEHINENLVTFSPLKPLSSDELLALDRAASAYVGEGLTPCTACNYCMPCPYGLDIPGLIAWHNQVRKNKLSDAKLIRESYEKAFPDPRRRADRCIGCEKCVSHCPQKINIPKEMDKISAFMEDYA